MDRARESLLAKEVDLIQIIRSRRFVHLAIKQLLDKAVRKELKQKSQFSEITLEQPVTRQKVHQQSVKSPSFVNEMVIEVKAKGISRVSTTTG